ncbi:MAG TPA: tol-pal system protein YbgF [Kofleriaceae bacterium]|nr:tol-pal system protein YbgF [Kofleriaceae bacterium]
MTSPRYVCLLFAVGCASPMSALRQDNQRLTQTVSQLRTERRVQDRRLRDLQHQLDEARGAAAMAVPVLPVEVAAPISAPGPATAPGSIMTSGERVVGVTEDGTEIVYQGEAITGKPPTPAQLDALSAPVPADDDPVPPRRASRTAAATLPTGSAGSAGLADVPAATDRIEVTRRVPPISARAAVRSKTRTPAASDSRDAPGERTGDAASDYRAAVELVRAGNHDDGLVALRAFIARYPRHDYADNAQYWIGEAYYAQKDYARALTEFRAVIEVYPRGNKVPDALLKVGYCYQALGQGDKAHAVLEQVVTRYPKSEPAALAMKRLETP